MPTNDELHEALEDAIVDMANKAKKAGSAEAAHYYASAANELAEAKASLMAPNVSH